jgi:hypothetical protein
MLLNSWAIALLLTAAAAVFLLGGAMHTALKVLAAWAPEKDTAAQIALENETWLASLLVRYGMALQLASLLLLLLAADGFSHVLVGAMCATGAFVANDYGIPALLVKLFGIFLYGFWLVLDGLDNRSELLPLTRLKFIYLLLLGPLLAADIALLLLYLINLTPDIITSCCGVVFSSTEADGNLLGPMPTAALLPLYSALVVLLFGLGRYLQKQNKTAKIGGSWLELLFALACLLFFIFSLIFITVVVSPYIYAMPSHRCPFDILRREYFGFGYPLYLFLFIATFSGMSCGILSLLEERPGLAIAVQAFRRTGFRIFFPGLALFLLLLASHPLIYLLKGGE